MLVFPPHHCAAESPVAEVQLAATVVIFSGLIPCILEVSSTAIFVAVDPQVCFVLGRGWRPKVV